LITVCINKNLTNRAELGYLSAYPPGETLFTAFPFVMQKQSPCRVRRPFRWEQNSELWKSDHWNRFHFHISDLFWTAFTTARLVPSYLCNS